MKKRVLVTGGFGRVGSTVIPYLLENGYEVKVFCRKDRPESPYRNRVEVCVGDLAIYENVYNAVRDADVVCHLAALFPPLFFDEEEIIRANVLGTFHVLQAMKDTGKKRLIFASTDAVYATGTSMDSYEKPLTEDMELNPINVYGITKVVNETTIKKYAGLFGISYVTLRFFWSMRPDEMVRLMFEARNYMEDILEEDKEGITEDTIVQVCCEDGSRYSDHITDFRDIGRAVYLAIAHEEVKNETLNIAAGDLVDYEKYAPVVAGKLGRPLRKIRVKGMKNYEADITKARELLDFEPAHSMEEMVKLAIGEEA